MHHFFHPLSPFLTIFPQKHTKTLAYIFIQFIVVISITFSELIRILLGFTDDGFVNPRSCRNNNYSSCNDLQSPHSSTVLILKQNLRTWVLWGNVSIWILVDQFTPSLQVICEILKVMVKFMVKHVKYKQEEKFKLEF